VRGPMLVLRIFNITPNMCSKQFYSFIAVGLLNTIIGYAIYLIFIWHELSVSLSLLMTYALGLTFNYYSSGRMVFKYRKFDRFPKFIFLYFTIFFGNLGLLKVLIIFFGFHASIAQALLLGPCALISFLIQRKIFDDKK